MLLLVIDNPFNRHWYGDLIGRVFTSATCPGYVNVRPLAVRV